MIHDSASTLDTKRDIAIAANYMRSDETSTLTLTIGTMIKICCLQPGREPVLQIRQEAFISFYHNLLK